MDVRASGHVVVQRRVPGYILVMTLIHVGEEAIAWILGEVAQKRTGRAWSIARIGRGARTMKSFRRIRIGRAWSIARTGRAWSIARIGRGDRQNPCQA